MSGEKTEKPTPKKLRDLREKGQVAQSKEVVSAALLIAFFALLAYTGSAFIDKCEALIVAPVPLLQQDFGNNTDEMLIADGKAMVQILAPFFGVALIVGIGGFVLQSGVVMSLKSISPSLDKISPGQYVKKTFAMQNVIEFLKSIVKVLVLAAIIVYVLRGAMQGMIRTPRCGLGCFQTVSGSVLMDVAVYSSAPFIIIAAIDFAYQKYSFTKKNMMSKDEVKREYKESEGDPMVKGRRRQLHQQMLTEGSVNKAQSASVLIANPTHIAVAIYYQRDETPLPLITAIGTDFVARRMIEAAVAAEVPVMRDVPLARSLLDTGMVNQYIPSELIEALAIILRTIESAGERFQPQRAS